MPLIRRQPKLGGFQNPSRVSYEVLNLDVLEAMLPAGSYMIQDLIERGLVQSARPVKILGRGAVQKKFVLQAHAASKTAKDAVAKAGGSITLLK